MEINTKNTVVITGGFGFLGSYLVEELISKKYQVVILVKSTTSKWRLKKNTIDQCEIIYVDKVSNIKEELTNYSIIALVHTAIDYGRESIDYSLFKNNVEFPLFIKNICDDLNVKKFINIDSYFNKKQNYNLDYLRSYILSKKTLEEWLKFSKSEMNIFNLKLEHVYGGKDTDRKFVNRIVYDLLSNKKTIELTSGEQKRDFIHVYDVINFIEMIISTEKDCFKKYNEYELGNGSSLSIKDFIIKVKNITGSNSELKFGEIKMRNNEIMDSYANLDMIKKQNIDWRAKVILEEGIKEVISNIKNKIMFL